MTSVVELAEHMARPARVLVIEGETGSAHRTLIEALSSYDCELVRISVTKDAVQAVSSQRFDIVFIDLRPDALDVIRELKRFSPQTAIIVFAGAENASVLNRALRWGMLAILHKPTGSSASAMQQIREALTLFKVRARAKPSVLQGIIA